METAGNRCILVAGASSTLGLAVAKTLAAGGNRLWLTHCREEKGVELASLFPQARISQLDALHPSRISAFCQEIYSVWGRLDGFVCAFGTAALEALVRFSDAQIAEIVQLNLISPMLLAKGLFRSLLKGQDASAVFFSSTMGLAGAPGMTPYSAAKGGLVGFSRCLAIEWAPRKIRVNAVAPGIIPSPLVSKMFQNLAKEQLQNIQQRHPLGVGEPFDVAHAVSFLLSPQSRWITGVVLGVDGGYLAQ